MLSILDLKPQPEKKSSAASKPVPEAPPPIETVKPPATPVEPAVKTNPQPATSSRSGAPAKSSEPSQKSTRPALRTSEVPVSEPVNIPEEPKEKSPNEKPQARQEAAREQEEPESDQEEWEIVLGRRQIASWLFVGIVLIALFSAAAFYAGRMSAPNPLAELDGKSAPYVAPAVPEATLPAATIVLPGENSIIAPGNSPQNTRVSPAEYPAPSTPAPAPAPVVSTPVQATPNPAPSPREWSGAAAPSDESPLFATPQTGALYLQMGAVDKGIAVVLAEGLRRHGFHSFVAPGPTEKIFRVLIGPFATQADYARAKAEVDAIDLSTFARRFQK
jgi:cell division septation protein DedD